MPESYSSKLYFHEQGDNKGKADHSKLCWEGRKEKKIIISPLHQTFCRKEETTYLQEDVTFRVPWGLSWGRETELANFMEQMPWTKQYHQKQQQRKKRDRDTMLQQWTQRVKGIKMLIEEDEKSSSRPLNGTEHPCWRKTPMNVRAVQYSLYLQQVTSTFCSI